MFVKKSYILNKYFFFKGGISMQAFDPGVMNSVAKHVAQIVGTLPAPLPTAWQAEGLTIETTEGETRILCEDANALARGLFLWATGKKYPEILPEERETRHFASCGLMLDQSRNAVMTPATVRRMIDASACLGMNMLMLYCEDTYTIPDYPAFGYLRGRYTREELQALDAYAAEVGVELIPCIQTLAHLATFLSWPSSAPLVDQKGILLIDEPETEKLIRAMIAEMRTCFRSKRIHIGMDEAHGVGLGRWREKHGETDRFELLSRHLRLVEKICAEYDFHAMMWSDMFFRLGSATNAYYDKEAVVPQSVIDHLPDVDLVYWDYYHPDEDMYDYMLTQHERMGVASFAGGIWTWSGFLPDVGLTRVTTLPALRVCARHEVNTVLATLWGDDGGETPTVLAMSQFPWFSEFCWRGERASEALIRTMGAAVSGLDTRLDEVYERFYAADIRRFTGKKLIWCDPLLPLSGMTKEELAAARTGAEEALSMLDGMAENDEVRYVRALFEVVRTKARLIAGLREHYLARDTEGLKADLADLERLEPAYVELYEAHHAIWRRDCKAFGWELLANRYGGAKQRAAEAARDLNAFLAGELDVIEELDAEPLNEDPGYGHRRLISAGESWGL